MAGQIGEHKYQQRRDGIEPRHTQVNGSSDRFFVGDALTIHNQIGDRTQHVAAILATTAGEHRREISGECVEGLLTREHIGAAYGLGGPLGEHFAIFERQTDEVEKDTERQYIGKIVYHFAVATLLKTFYQRNRARANCRFVVAHHPR